MVNCSGIRIFPHISRCALIGRNTYAYTYIHKTKDRVTGTPLKTRGELMCPGRISSSCSYTVRLVHCFPINIFSCLFLRSFHYIINMGQKQSKECVDKKGTDNLSAQDAVIDIVRRLAEHEGPIAVSAYIDKSFDRCKKQKVMFAITGRSATGKSTFINTIINLKPGDDGFAMAGFGDTTIKPKSYIHPKNDQIAFYDLPGYSSTTFKKEDYISAMKISDYDFVFNFLTMS